MNRFETLLWRLRVWDLNRVSNRTLRRATRQISQRHRVLRDPPVRGPESSWWFRSMVAVGLLVIVLDCTIGLDTLRPRVELAWATLRGESVAVDIDIPVDQLDAICGAPAPAPEPEAAPAMLRTPREPRT